MCSALKETFTFSATIIDLFIFQTVTTLVVDKAVDLEGMKAYVAMFAFNIQLHTAVMS